MIKIIPYLSLILLLTNNLAVAKVSPANLFGSHMVLQRDQPIKLWGTADPGEEIRVTFNHKIYQTKGETNGQWQIMLDQQSAGGPYEMLIEGENKILFSDILFGDVWVASGQSNMQWQVKQTPFSEEDSLWLAKNKLRLFTVEIDVDYQPRTEVKGGSWMSLSVENINTFSAVAYHFSKHLCQNLEIPVGIINSSLGASSIEAWMSNETLNTFDQFKPEIGPVVEMRKSAAVITEEFNKVKESWEKEVYLTGPGIEEKWYLPDTNVDDWKEVTIPGTFIEQGFENYEGAVWYRKHFDLPDSIIPDSFLLPLTQIDDYDICWVNGEKVGETFGRHNFRNYWVLKPLLKEKDNLLVVRAFNIGDVGGFTTNAFWMTGWIQGKWKSKPGLKINGSTFKTDPTVNITPFSSPGVLYNANIAPLTNLGVKGCIWYQGESNADRAQEYRSLFPALIEDWRKAWNNQDLAFYFVQLANYTAEKSEPGASDWAELREAQTLALDLPQTGMAVTIDIGEADDIHPLNKVDVGIRLALNALKTTYQKNVVAQGPTLESIKFENGRALLTFKHVGSGLITRNKFGYVHGFELAGKDQQFKWAQAKITGNTVTVFCDEITDPIAVRYNWANNPGTVDLYNQEGLPAVPFRSDRWPGITDGKLFDYRASRF